MKTITIPDESAAIIATALRRHLFDLETFCPGAAEQQQTLRDALEELMRPEPEAAPEPRPITQSERDAMNIIEKQNLKARFMEKFKHRPDAEALYYGFAESDTQSVEFWHAHCLLTETAPECATAADNAACGT